MLVHVELYWPKDEQHTRFRQHLWDSLPPLNCFFPCMCYFVCWFVLCILWQSFKWKIVNWNLRGGGGGTEITRTALFWRLWVLISFIISETDKYSTGHAIPNNCYVMYHGNTEEVIQGRNGYLTKILFVARGKVEMRSWFKVQRQRSGLIFFRKSLGMEKFAYILRCWTRSLIVLFHDRC